MNLDNFSNLTLSMVSINDEIIEKVAARCSTSIERVKRYLDTSEQDSQLLGAFLFYGISPFNKGVKSVKETTSMGTMVGQSYCPICNKNGER